MKKKKGDDFALQKLAPMQLNGHAFRNNTKHRIVLVQCNLFTPTNKQKIDYENPLIFIFHSHFISSPYLL